MNRYEVYVGVEGEYQPGSRKRVLKNLLGIASKTEMDSVEYQAYIAVREKYFRGGNIVTPDTRFTAEIIKQMHYDWLGGTYEWAGKYRSVDMSKGGFPFPPALLVADNMRSFDKEVLALHTPCKPGDLSEVCKSLAVVHAELLLIHPFREGNGRLARWLAEMMSAQANLPLPDYGFTGRGSEKRRASYLDAVIKGYRGDYADLIRFFELTFWF